MTSPRTIFVVVVCVALSVASWAAPVTSKKQPVKPSPHASPAASKSKNPHAAPTPSPIASVKHVSPAPSPSASRKHKDGKSSPKGQYKQNASPAPKPKGATLSNKTAAANKSINDAGDLDNRAARVVNGVPVTDKSEYPFVADLSFDEFDISRTRFCTGTLIRPDVVLTAAHCVLNEGYSSPVYVTIGRIELEDGHSDNERATTFRTVASIPHPEYDGIGSPKDVALLLLNASSRAPPVRLSDGTPEEGAEAWVVGYGIQKMGTFEKTGRPAAIMSGRLQKTKLRVEQNSFCDVPEADFRTPDGLLCTAGVKLGSSACRGDSGGGLFLMAGNGAKKDVVQVGIVSYGDAQCSSEEAGIFTDVAHVKEWVTSEMTHLEKALSPVHFYLDDNSKKEIVFRGRIKEHYHGLRFAARQKLKDGQDTKYFSIRTDFSMKRHVTMSLCGGPSGYKAHLSVKNEKDSRVVQDSGSCPDGKLSQVTLSTKKDLFVVGISGNSSAPFRLSLLASPQ